MTQKPDVSVCNNYYEQKCLIDIYRINRIMYVNDAITLPHSLGNRRSATQVINVLSLEMFLLFVKV